MADGKYDWERNQIDRIYETTENVAKNLRRMADDIDREVARAKDNEGTTETFRTTYLDLPGSVVNIVVQGLANAQLDSPARQLRELILGRGAFGALAAEPIIARLQEFHRVWTENPLNNTKIYSLEYMTGPEDARVEAIAQIDTDLLQEIIDLLPKKAS